jgi:hypothetical protein
MNLIITHALGRAGSLYVGVVAPPKERASERERGRERERELSFLG